METKGQIASTHTDFSHQNHFCPHFSGLFINYFLHTSILHNNSMVQSVFSWKWPWFMHALLQLASWKLFCSGTHLNANDSKHFLKLKHWYNTSFFFFSFTKLLIFPQDSPEAGALSNNVHCIRTAEVNHCISCCNVNRMWFLGHSIYVWIILRTSEDNRKPCTSPSYICGSGGREVVH